MNPIPKDEIISKIVEVVRLPFEERGFSLKRKRFFEREDSYGNIQQYEINLSKLKGYFSLHLRLNILNKPLLKKVNVVLEKALLDEEYPYPETWDDKWIADTVKLRIKNNFLAGVTDWRGFKKDDESLEEFNSRFAIWVCIFDDINENENWKLQLLMSVEFAEKWFLAAAQSDEWVIDNTEYPSLYLLKEQGRFDELAEKYEAVLHQARLKKEVELFYKYLLL